MFEEREGIEGVKRTKGFDQNTLHECMKFSNNKKLEPLFMNDSVGP